MPINLHSRCAGEGSSVLVLHGLFGAGNNLGALARELQANYRTCLLDLPNHGRSAWLTEPDLPAMANEVLLWMDSQALQGVHLVGHSLGGKVAMQLALAHSERVLSLVVADIAPVAYEPRHQAVFAALKSVALSQCESREEAAALMHEYLQEEGVVQFLLASLRRDEDGIMQWRFDREGLEAGYKDLLAAPNSQSTYNGPVQFIKGADSDYITKENWPAVQALFPQAEIKVMAECGHWLHAQKPQLFNTTVARFLGEHS